MQDDNQKFTRSTSRFFTKVEINQNVCFLGTWQPTWENVMEIFFLCLRLANKMEEMASLELVARGVAMNAMKKGETPEAFEKPPIASTKGSAKKAARAAPAIKYSTAVCMICAFVGGALFSSSASSLSSSSCSSCNIARKFLTICNQDPKVSVNWNHMQYQCMILKSVGQVSKSRGTSPLENVKSPYLWIIVLRRCTTVLGIRMLICATCIGKFHRIPPFFHALEKLLLSNSVILWYIVKFFHPECYFMLLGHILFMFDPQLLNQPL